jgi:CHAD domain-containing protein
MRGDSEGAAKDANIVTDSMAIITTGNFAKKEADELLRRVDSQIARTMKSQGVDELHDLRVASRRFIRILSALAPCFPRGESKRMRRGLKRIMVQAGDIRDYDIAIHLINRMELPDSGTLLRQIQKRREQFATVLSATLHRWTARNLPARWRAALNSDRAPRKEDAGFCAVPAATMAKRLLPDMVAEHFQRGEAAVGKKMPAHKIHRFRIAAKNFRYTLDFFAPLYAGTLPLLIDRLKDVQTLLGDINDCATARRIVKEEVAGDGDDAVRGDVLAGLKDRQRKKIKEFREQYTAEFSSTSVLRQWQESVRRVGAAKSAPVKKGSVAKKRATTKVPASRRSPR